MTDFSFNISEQDFEQRVVQASYRQPVVVDFWAEWCAPCRALKPMLESLALAYQGRFLLAKVDTERAQALAARCGVRGIPDVRAFVNGQVVDGFTGAMPESALRQFIERILPSAAEPLRLEASEHRRAGRTEQAQACLREAIARDPEHEAAQLDLIDLLADLGETDEAARLLRPLRFRGRDSARIEALDARLRLAAEADAAPDADTLAERVHAAPDDLAARLALARSEIAACRWESALAHLLEIVEREPGFEDEAARKAMVQIFALPEVDRALMRRYRSALASAINR